MMNFDTTRKVSKPAICIFWDQAKSYRILREPQIMRFIICSKCVNGISKYQLQICGVKRLQVHGCGINFTARYLLGFSPPHY